MNVITVEREFGAGGATIAKRLTERLGWELWDSKITAEIATRLKCDERSVLKREEKCDGTFDRLVRAFMRGGYEEHFAGKHLERLDADELAALFEGVIADVATRGKCVIVGRGAPYFLRFRRDAFHVFVYNSFENKVNRVMRRTEQSREQVEEMVNRVDRERAAFITKYYNKVWPQRDLYHLMINSKVGDDRVVDTILFEMEALSRSDQDRATA
jgi:CMP/dCMP kinase